MQRCYGCHNISQNLLTNSGLSILLHGFISLRDATSYDKYVYSHNENQYAGTLKTLVVAT